MKVIRKDGKIHSHKLELNVVEHCNLKCVECSHLSPYIHARSLELDSVKRDLAALSPVFHCSSFRFVGGEPLLHRRLIEFIHAVRESGISDHIEVISNGTLVDKVPDEFYQSIDKLQISWYPNTPTDQKKIDFAAAQCAKFDKRLALDDKPVFRKMQIDHAIDDADLVQKIYNSCRIAHISMCHAVHDGYYYKCSRPMFSGRYLELKGISAPDLAHEDGVYLDAPDLLTRLRRYIESAEPLLSCRYCLGTVGKFVQHRQMSIEETHSTEVDPRSADELVDWNLLRFSLASRRILNFADALFPNLLRRKVMRLLRQIRPKRGVMEQKHSFQGQADHPEGPR